MKATEDAPATGIRPRAWTKLWLKPMVGFLLSGLGLSLGHPLSRNALTQNSALSGSVTTAVWVALSELVLVGIVWIWLGSKLFRGPIGMGESVRGVGDALYLPSASMVLIVSVPYPGIEAGEPLALALTGTLMILTAWALVRISSIVRRLNGFGLARTLGVMLWPLIPITLMCAPIQLLFWQATRAALEQG